MNVKMWYNKNNLNFRRVFFMEKDLIMKKEASDIIVEIAKRAEEKGLLAFDRLSLIMDLECTNKQFNLRLNEFLNADDFNFTHDICGIQNNLNRETMKMENYFTPRFSGRK
jgi:hypothetical protein